MLYTRAINSVNSPTPSRIRDIHVIIFIQTPAYSSVLYFLLSFFFHLFNCSYFRSSLLSFFTSSIHNLSLPNVQSILSSPSVHFSSSNPFFPLLLFHFTSTYAASIRDCFCNAILRSTNHCINLRINFFQSSGVSLEMRFEF
jgi:hypothetical protein